MSSLTSLIGGDSDVLQDADFRLLLIATLPAPLGTTLLSPILDSLIDPFSVSTADIGLMISIFTAPAIIVIPLAGILADRYGRKPILVVALLLFGASGTAIAFTTNFHVVLGFRLVQGAAFAGINPIIITSIGDLYVTSKEATAQGLRFAAGGLGATVFPLLAGWLVVFAWQYPFFLHLLTFPIAGFVYLWFEEPVSGRRDSTTIDRDGTSGDSHVQGLLSFVIHRRVAALVVARGLPMVIWTGFVAYNSIIVVRVIGGTPTQAGLLVAIGSFTLASSATQTGRITALFDNRLYPLVIANLALGVGFTIVLFASSILVAGIGLVLLGMGGGVTLSLYRSVITGLAPPSLRGGIVSIAESFGRVTATLTPIAIGAIIAAVTPIFGFTLALRTAGLVCAGIGAIGGILCLLIARSASPVPHPNTPSSELT